MKFMPFLKITPRKNNLLIRLLEYSSTHDTFTVNDLIRDLELTPTEIVVLNHDNTLDQYFPVVDTSLNKDKNELIRSASLFARGRYIDHLEILNAQKLSWLAFVVALGAFVAASFTLIVESIEMFTIQPVEIIGIDANLLD